jgi:hypothetical protein
MPEATSRKHPTQDGSAIFSTRPPQALKKRRGQLIAASVLLAIWVVFLVAMAAYN